MPTRLFIFLAVLSGCSSSTSGGVRVSVRFLDTDAQCAKVFVTGANRLVRASVPLARLASDRIVGIAQDEYTGGGVDIVARGYRATDCSGAAIDSSKVEHRDFVAGDLSPPALLVLKGGATPPDAGVPDAGPPDAGKSDAGFDAGFDAGPNPMPEQCGNGVDDDLDGTKDCFDPECLNQDCNFGRRCTAIGVCAVPPTELLCNDGLDDDKDGDVDCADSDCNNRSCADTNACTYGETCQSKLCKAAVTNTCSTPNECQVGMGSCLADAGCGYMPKAGSCDGGTCFNGDCILGFPFVPSNGVNALLPSSALVPKVTLDCGVSTYDSDTNVFGNWCSQPMPTPRIVGRLGVQNLVVLPMAGLDLKNQLRLTGSKPVVLLVYGDASITGHLNVSAKGAAHGAGGPADNCPGMGEPGTALIYASGGGGGAGFAQVGGKGGAVGGNPVAGAFGGGIYLLTPNVLLRGGCAGSDGASGQVGQLAAPGGGAGGAVQLSVSGTLTVDGTVSANGGGGAGGVTISAGGGGAGSGGGLLLEANRVVLTGNARLTSHGGGGGGGARANDDGTNGEDGHADDASPADGGEKAGSQAGNGGVGGSTAAPTAGEDATGTAAGGGGASVGRIHLRSITPCSTSSGRLVSPVATGDCP